MLGTGFTYPQYASTSDDYQSLPKINSQDRDDPENEEICGLYDADCEDTSPTKNVEIDLARAESAAVVPILFWMQDCAHCAEVLNTLLPEMYLTFNNQVYFYPIELKEIDEVDLFYQMAERLGVPKNNIGVPLIIIGNQVLAGNQIDSYLKKSIETELEKSPYTFTAIPEFEVNLPDFLQNKQVDQTSMQTNTSNDSQSILKTFPLMLTIGFPVLLVAGAIAAVFFRKSILAKPK